MDSQVRTRRILDELVKKLYHPKQRIPQEGTQISHEGKETLLILRGSDQDIGRVLDLLGKERDLRMKVDVLVENRPQGSSGPVQINRSHPKVEQRSCDQMVDISKKMNQRGRWLITEKDILDYYACYTENRVMFLSMDTIITPLARDRAKALGIELKKEKSPS